MNDTMYDASGTHERLVERNGRSETLFMAPRRFGLEGELAVGSTSDGLITPSLSELKAGRESYAA
jgi:hypothetical protein